MQGHLYINNNYAFIPVMSSPLELLLLLDVPLTHFIIET